MVKRTCLLLVMRRADSVDVFPWTVRLPMEASVTLSPAKAAALQEIQAAIGAARDAQKKGDFAAYGTALQRLDDAITKYNNTK